MIAHRALQNSCRIAQRCDTRSRHHAAASQADCSRPQHRPRHEHWMQLVASVSAALDRVHAALDQPVSASATSRLRPKNAPKRPMTTILFTRPNIHRVDRSSAWLKLRGHTRKKKRGGTVTRTHLWTRVSERTRVDDDTSPSPPPRRAQHETAARAPRPRSSVVLRRRAG